jgi:hypothetical protein
MRIVERLAAHYEVEDVQFGRVFVWRPESVVAECECGKRATYERLEIVSGSVSACECGEDYNVSYPRRAGRRGARRGGGR